MADSGNALAGRGFLALLVLSLGLGGECRWRFSSNTSGHGRRDKQSDRPVPLTLGGPADSVLPARGGRALLYATGSWDSDIRWLDLEMGRSWPLLRSVSPPVWLVRVLDDRFEFADMTCEPILHACRFGENEPTGLGLYYLSDRRTPRERTLYVDASRILHWEQGGASVEIPLSFPARGAVYEAGWPAPLAWDYRGDLMWVDLASGAGAPAFPFRPLRRTP
jgi:hypothetical protein